jgi:4,5-DOPA dioxygenase extradiol
MLSISSSPTDCSRGITAMPRFPAVFVSHGAPTLILSEAAARGFLAGFGKALGRPSAILAVSAHWETATPRLSSATEPETIHDFYGFPRALYEMRYRAPGAPALARRAAALLDRAGIAAASETHGLDHGAWVPLMLMYPDADIPVTQLSVQTGLGAAHQLKVGAALQALREDGVLILASGSATHNLGELRMGTIDAPAVPWVTEFTDWLAQAVEDGRTGDLVDYRTRAPNAPRNHPSEEHFLPFFTALGAAGAAKGRRVHASTTYGALAMDAYRWD